MSQDNKQIDEHLIEVSDPDVKIEPFVEDVIGFVIFWVLASVVFLQFFSRYVLNDSYAWTEEISRYLLMWLTFVGAATAMRRGSHIGVEAIQHFMPSPLARLSRLVIDAITLGFLACLCWFGVAITERMQIQTMTVIEWPMSIVYGGVFVGCCLMLYRYIRVVWGNYKRRWQPDPDKVNLLID
ncbi:TRAP transporter small permease [Ferrovibrio sp.]|uniref:TRAP transporter small permease n=1 Tax=Ferrovibrio sp. TaxID=1917215 RepID=UPI0025C1FC81|nr:TRAP transporter small permease [Ferrovibrio sp.]MBX3454469.1 TRAP transporter small permease [Ferrovibrio sp.]